MRETTNSKAPKWKGLKPKKKESPPNRLTWIDCAVVWGVIYFSITGWLLSRAELSMGFKILIGVKEAAAFFFVLWWVMPKSRR